MRNDGHKQALLALIRSKAGTVRCGTGTCVESTTPAGFLPALGGTSTAGGHPSWRAARWDWAV